MEPEFEIGEAIKDTSAFGDVTVKDIFVSKTNSQWFCYRVEDANGQSYFSTEEDLFPDTTFSAD